MGLQGAQAEEGSENYQPLHAEEEGYDPYHEDIYYGHGQNVESYE